MSGAWVRRTVPLVLMVGLFVVGCASPPETEKKAADAAMSAATAAGAEKYAPKEFAAVRDAVKTAESQMSAKSYKEAKESYEKVKGLAEKAAQAAASGKAAMKVEVETQIGALEKGWQALETKAQAVSKKLKPEQKTALAEAAKGVKDAIQAAKDAVGSDPAAAKDKLAAAGATIEKWTADLAAMAMPAKAATPAKPATPAPAKKKP